MRLHVLKEQRERKPERKTERKRIGAEGRGEKEGRGAASPRELNDGEWVVGEIDR